MMRKSVWTRQPQASVGIDLNNPIARGISFLVNYGGSRLDLISKRPPVTNAGLNIVSAKGIAVGTGASGGDMIYPATPGLEPISGSLSVMCVLLKPAIDIAASSRIVSHWDGVNGNWILTQDGVSSTGRYAMYIYNGSFVGAVGATSIVANKPYCVIGTFSPGKVAVYLDGVLDGTNTYAGSASAFPAIQLGIGTHAGGGQDANAHIYVASVWQRELTAAECRSLSINPWQLFAPQTRRIFAPSAAAAPGGFIPAWAYGATSVLGVGVN